MINEIDNLHFEEVYINHYSKLKRFAKEYVLIEEDAENIVHDTFTDLWEHWPELESHSNLMAFLFLSIKNKCIDLLRHRIVARKAENKIVEEYQLALSANYYSLDIFNLDKFDEKDIEQLISRALSTLPERCRTIFIMSKIEGKKQKQISQELNISMKTVEAQISIAYKKLRQELKDFLPLLIFLFY